MAEKRLLRFESYYAMNDEDKLQWRITNAPGLCFYEDASNYTWWLPAYCDPALIDEISKVISQMSVSEDKW